MTHSITFKTPVQAALFKHELSGQISDGLWENTPNTGWVDWCSADVLVGDNVGVKGFYPEKNNFNFVSSMLLECVGDRMLKIALLAKAGYNDEEISDLHWTSDPVETDEVYTMKDLKNDLREMKKAIKIFAV